MSESVKHLYTVDLQQKIADEPASQIITELRSPARDDLETLGQLMLDAYMGTIDDEGEGLAEAYDEVEAYFDDAPLLAASYIAFVDEAAVSAILLSVWRGDPLVGYVMTHPAYKNQGLAGVVLRVALQSLADARWAKVYAFITEGNTASEALFRSAGAVKTPVF